ncbi:Cytochrome c1 heme lyase [Coemansia erecta]|uniref:Holocytochrome c-type synthase n=1 Tax=Coemansia erecta TaxID=147472 RepID=A0A9W8CRV9_9FUNG|nr:Cytochrome c1 heme lyase [Coemansia erecta]
MTDGACTGDHCPVDFSTRRSSSGSSSSGGCPVDHSSMGAGGSSAAYDTSDTSPGSTYPIYQDPAPALDPTNQMPLVAEQQAHPTQTHGLSTQRTISSIPRAPRYQSSGASACPVAHEPSEEPPTKDTTSSSSSSDENKPAGMWVYPSEQMFFNAMRRKNWSPHEADMHTVVPIHNAVNEQCWKMIMRWEQMHSSECAQPMLLRFEGLKNKVSPRARWRTWMGYQPPFDRHDWTVDRCGKQVRYVIDFYQGARNPDAPGNVAFHLDVRPALTPAGAWDRMRRFASGLFS